MCFSFDMNVAGTMISKVIQSVDAVLGEELQRKIAWRTEELRAEDRYYVRICLFVVSLAKRIRESTGRPYVRCSETESYYI
jgi:hypothetical protein